LVNSPISQKFSNNLNTLAEYPPPMDGFWYHMMYEYPYGWMFIGMGIVWIIQLIIGYFVYRDARNRQMNALLWLVLVILPMIGWLFLVIYMIYGRWQIMRNRQVNQPCRSWMNGTPGGRFQKRSIGG
jgi:uncharacterized membrane protein